MLGQLRWGAADETPTGDGVNVSAENVSGERRRKRGFLMESNQRRAKQTNMNHAAVIGIAVVVQRLNTESKYCSAGQDQARFCEFSLVAKCPCSIPAQPQTHKHSKYTRGVCVRTNTQA